MSMPRIFRKVALGIAIGGAFLVAGCSTSGRSAPLAKTWPQELEGSIGYRTQARPAASDPGLSPTDASTPVQLAER